MTPAAQSKNSSVNINALRPYQGFTNIRLYESSAASSYHGLQVGLTRRYSNDLTFSLAYTWSKVLTDASGQDDGVEDLLNSGAERSHASFDRNHILAMSYVYNLPFFRTQSGLIGKLLSGWQLSGIIQAQSGAWLTPSINTATGGRRPDLIGNASSRDFGTISDAGHPRLIQFALNLTF